MNIKEIEQLIKKKLYSEALEACDSLLDADLTNFAEISRLKTWIYTSQGQYRAGIAELERIIKTGDATIGDYHSAGFWSLYEEEFSNAADWFSAAIDLGKKQDDQWFESSAQFYLSYSNMMLGDYQKAKEILEKSESSDNNKEVFIPIVGSYTRSDLLAEIERRS